MEQFIPAAVESNQVGWLFTYLNLCVHCGVSSYYVGLVYVQNQSLFITLYCAIPTVFKFQLPVFANSFVYTWSP